MFSLLGFPGTFGFMGKWAIIQAAVGQHGELQAVVLVVTSLVSAGYYLPVVRAIYMRQEIPRPNDARDPVPGTADFAVTVAVALIIFFGIMPHGALTVANAGVRGFPGAAAKVAQTNR
jgi:NADH-quinone oxidoreductase subunit N